MTRSATRATSRQVLESQRELFRQRGFAVSAITDSTVSRYDYLTKSARPTKGACEKSAQDGRTNPGKMGILVALIEWPPK
ncbi:hypothetical protein Prum_025560 [Phytohabitans rumicis]|uniref:Uncharacterized protein n=1 Tax=Phytohabitans rumicis TaxID=1076125 RepID=A0A6V8KYJ6_9ACTN|nr:hypothetical protein Prum_025560 [Phytohabitans rumicis]